MIYWTIFRFFFFSVCQLNYIIIVIIAYKQVHYRQKKSANFFPYDLAPKEEI